MLNNDRIIWKFQYFFVILWAKYTNMEERILKSATLKKGYGTMSELENEITPEEVLHLQLGGYIENGISNEGETFRLTKRGKDMLYYYSDDVSIKHRIQGFLLRYVLGFNVAL